MPAETKKSLPEFYLGGKVVLVTGALGLIGQEICDAIAMAGGHVVTTDLQAEPTREMAKTLESQYGHRSLGLPMDITQDDSVETCIDTIIQEFDKIDVLINCAAIDAKLDNDHVDDIDPSRFEYYPLELWQKSLDVNMTGMIRVTQHVVREMVKNQSGNIINVTSTYGCVAPDQGLYQENGIQKTFKPVDYVATKSFIPGFTRYLATLYANEGIRANTIVPHGVFNNHSDPFLTEFKRRSPLGRMCQSQELRGPFVFLASDASSYMTGSLLIVDGGWTAW